MLLADVVQKPLQPLGNSSPTRLPQCNNHHAPVLRVNVWERVEKISICGEDYRTRLNRLLCYDGIAGTKQSDGAQIHSFMSFIREYGCHASGKILIEQKPHATAS